MVEKEKIYTFKFTQEEINAIWLVSLHVEGEGKYKEAFDRFRESLKPYVSDYLKEPGVDLSKYCTGRIVFRAE
jgi:hypothetical protein